MEGELNDHLNVQELLQPIDGSDSSSESSDHFSDGEQSDSNGISDILEAADMGAGGPIEEDILFPLMQLMMYGRRRQRVENYLDTVHQKSNEEFRSAFRLTRPIAYQLIEDLERSGYISTHDFGRPKKTPEISFLMFLWYVGNEEPLRILSEIFDMSESSIFRIIRRVVDWLVTLLPTYISWPRRNNIIRVANGFARAQGLRGCIGAIDGCHICIIKPMDNAPEYFNRKHYCSINLTAIADSDRKFLMVYCGDPGSFHDTRVFRRSDFFHEAVNHTAEVFPNGTYLIGDGGYQGVGPDWLVHPYRDLGNLTQSQREFNRMLSSTRVVIEQTFGILKGRFRRLLHQVNLFDIPFTVDLIVSCCILHNICLNYSDDGQEFYNHGWNVEQPEEQAGNHDHNNATRRDRLFQEIFPLG